MNGEIQISNLKDLMNVRRYVVLTLRAALRLLLRFQLWLDNRESLGAMGTGISSAFSRYSAFAINALGRQSLRMARWNVVRRRGCRSLHELLSQIVHCRK